jgi:hypothetical protein
MATMSSGKADFGKQSIVDDFMYGSNVATAHVYIRMGKFLCLATAHVYIRMGKFLCLATAHVYIRMGNALCGYSSYCYQINVATADVYISG